MSSSITNNEGILIESTPDDYISDLVISELPNIGPCLLVTAWDGTLSIYKTNSEITNKDKLPSLYKRGKNETPLICCCVLNLDIYVGTVQGQLLRYDIGTNMFKPVLVTGEDVSTLALCKIFVYGNHHLNNSLICISWDGSISVVDVGLGKIDMRIQLKEDRKILSADCNSNKLILVETGHKLRLFELPLREQDEGISMVSALKYQIRDIKLLPTSSGYVISSIDGRVAVEYLNEPERQFAFRCHRLNLKDTQFVFPVNTLAFCPGTSKMLTGGSDGAVSFWNLDTRRKLKQFPKFNSNSVVKLVCDKDMFYVATSDDSFKTNATIDSNIELQPSNIYIVSI
ncbi:similar to Saccharomyces cerevisiae YOR026W BUB3 Kinetochore checkpoint WD40 repeat protein that localizes to kinetochores during prophase and metaphase [Maudiozyma barnettii]|uniref:Similar to Saccharomyces cerevisiae YOR026W BUB3 Kinetochore checkpoint WD40 repeat protein that localizes to kinetochores during prophase and metaphase n=1 Tax=Maudiozyma barnettii TaxID=61262 RepID=A0A8H2VJ17_9SACH|nr:Bub3p [Kazachstania barnettii]CAB4256306.1 similar to Saccharomyces cerevisiae YOR026W BUB3 Kinetochore checkpoint WD40 repeat protein that localizes to kinetochores during prophase and metaphase [Kazachstania barnettii]CAD1784915.1 similar to Saccharomyces cerevisiae YOR026W BUB3 Kinetochore checkpoint WD40 repeat protein that localizes to kinetochores during prophase and metaphase [Kazachstania barnettii]